MSEPAGQDDTAAPTWDARQAATGADESVVSHETAERERRNRRRKRPIPASPLSDATSAESRRWDGRHRLLRRRPRPSTCTTKARGGGQPPRPLPTPQIGADPLNAYAADTVSAGRDHVPPQSATSPANCTSPRGTPLPPGGAHPNLIVQRSDQPREGLPTAVDKLNRPRPAHTEPASSHVHTDPAQLTQDRRVCRRGPLRCRVPALPGRSPGR